MLKKQLEECKAVLAGAKARQEKTGYK